MANFALSPPNTKAVSTDQQEIASQRFEMRMSQRLFQRLGMLANKENLSKPDVVRRALGLYAQAIEAEEKGQLVGFGRITDDSDVEVTELIRLNSQASKEKVPNKTKGIARSEPFTRFEMRASEALLYSLGEMSEKEGIPRSDVVRRALGLYSLALEAEAKNQLVLFANLNKDNTVSVVEAIKLR